MKSQWVRRRWLDFRNGHGLYLVFLMGFGKFGIFEVFHFALPGLVSDWLYPLIKNNQGNWLIIKLAIIGAILGFTRFVANIFILILVGAPKLALIVMTPMLQRAYSGSPVRQTDYFTKLSRSIVLCVCFMGKMIQMCRGNIASSLPKSCVHQMCRHCSLKMAIIGFQEIKT